MALSVGSLIVVLFLTYYSLYFIKLLFKKERVYIKTHNEQLDTLRQIPIKSVDEQKKFIDLKYPKRQKFSFSWNIVGRFILQLVEFIAIFWIISFIFNFFNIVIKLWIAITLMIVLPIIINIILEKFKLEKSDIRQFLR